MDTNVFKRFYYPTKVNRFLADDKSTEPILIILLYSNPRQLVQKYDNNITNVTI